MMVSVSSSVPVVMLLTILRRFIRTIGGGSNLAVVRNFIVLPFRLVGGGQI